MTEPMTDISKVYQLVKDSLAQDGSQRSIATDLSLKIVDLIKESNVAVIEEMFKWAKEINMCGDLVATSDLMRYLEELKWQQRGEMTEGQDTLKSDNEYPTAEVPTYCIWCGAHITISKRDFHPRICPYFQEFIHHKVKS